MEPKKVVKKFTEFSDSNYPSIFNNCGYRPVRTFRKIMELPMGNRLGLFDVDAEKPVKQNSFIKQPWELMEVLSPRFSKTNIQPIQVIFRNGINADEIELQDFMRDWLHNVGIYTRGYKRNVCIKTLDPTGVEIEGWNLRGCFPLAIIYSDNDNGTQNLEMTLHYDHYLIN